MIRKRNLSKDINMKSCADTSNALDISIDKIKDMVDGKITSADVERKSYTMKSKKKISLIAIAATLVLGITVFAASGIISNWYSSSSSIPDYKSLPTEQQCIKDIGYAPTLIETFENGYSFSNGSIVNNNLKDENKKSVERFKSVMFRYKKDGDEVIFSQDKYNSETEKNGDVVKNIDGIDVYYFNYTNKVVPPDYKLTDEDKKAEANGELVFSYGSSKVEINEVQSISWLVNDMHYELMQINGKLSVGELVDMATEIIDNNNQ